MHGDTDPAHTFSDSKVLRELRLSLRPLWSLGLWWDRSEGAVDQMTTSDQPWKPSNLCATQYIPVLTIL
jgi:hypothetical protein